MVTYPPDPLPLIREGGNIEKMRHQRDGVLKEGEIREFKLTPPVAVRFGLGSTVAIKRWGRFELRQTGDLYWIDAMNIRKDVDKTNTHIALHKSGEIWSSRKVNGETVSLHHVGKIDARMGQAEELHQSGQELLEPGYLYYGLKTLEEQKKTPPAVLVECLDSKLVNSRLYYSLDIFPKVGNEKVVEYAARLSQPFCAGDQRSHLYIFFWGKMALAVSMRFTEGDQPIDIQRVHEADSHPHTLKRLYFEENLQLSEKCSLSPSVGESGESLS